MKKMYFRGLPVKIGDVVKLCDVNVILTQEFVDMNSLMFKTSNISWDIEFVKCLSWSGESHTPGIVYPVVNGMVLNQDGSNQQYPTILDTFYSCFEDSSSYEYHEQIIKEAKQRYPVGTSFIPTSCTGKNPTVSTIKEDTVFFWNTSFTTISTSLYPGDIYIKGDNKWAEIKLEIPEYIKIKDDVEQNTGRWAAREPGRIYKVIEFKPCIVSGDMSYYVSRDTCVLPLDCQPVTKVEFETQELINQLVEIGKDLNEVTQKTLEDYENILLLNDEETTDTDFTADWWEMYYWIKRNAPKLYWSKVLELIAEDLNEGWTPDWNSSSMKYKIQRYQNKFEIGSNAEYNGATVYFKSTAIANQAIQLMGDNLKVLYNV